MSNTKFRVSKVKDEYGVVIEKTYEYRGYQFRRTDANVGYWDAYKLNRSYHSSQAEVKAAIDRLIEEKKNV